MAKLAMLLMKDLTKDVVAAVVDTLTPRLLLQVLMASQQRYHHQLGTPEPRGVSTLAQSYS